MLVGTSIPKVENKSSFREVTISYVSGLCVDGPCWVEYIIYRCVLLNWKNILTVGDKLRKGI